MKTRNSSIAVPNQSMVQRLTVSTDPVLYGLEPIFACGSDDALMSLSFEGTSPFLDWIGWEKTNVQWIRRNFISWVRAADTGQGASTPGWLADPCGDPNGTQFDTCDFTLEDFARLRRAGPVRDITKSNMVYWQTQPRYRLDGTQINNDREFDMRLATEVIMNDLKLMVIDGNKNTSGQFSGLENLVKTGYTNSSGALCKLMDSIVINWNNRGVDGGAGITWNGAAVASTYGLIDVILAVYRRIKHRIRMAPALAAQGLSVGDMILLLPDEFVDCILDAYTCWAVCNSDWNSMNTFEARKYRESLAGGMFGSGRIFLDGFEIPIMPYDWNLIKSGQTFDFYFLTGAVGNMKIIQGQYNDMSFPAQVRADRFSTDGGRLLTWSDDDQTCEKQIVEMQPRMMIWAPWAQARFQAVVCATAPGGVISADPWSNYFPYP